MLGPALLAAAVAIIATVAVERLGGRAGGVLVTLPTTIVPASWGMLQGAAATPAFQDAMGAVPVGMAVDALFLWTWRAVPPHLTRGAVRGRLLAMVALSLAVWLGAAALAILTLDALRAEGVSPLLVGAGATAVQLVAGVRACRDAPLAPRGTRRVGPRALLARGLLAGTAIACAIAVARAGAPLAAGMASVFPAIFLTTMVSLWIAQGEAVPIGAVGPMILGSTSVCVYALVAAWTGPAWGAPGLAVAWCAAVATTSLPAGWWLTTPHDTRGT